jgi:hypothetical protein
MHQAVRDNFVDFQQPMEGKVLWMYADSLGLVSIAIGNLIDPVNLALALPSEGAPYTNKNTGAAATDAEIQADFNAVKSSGAGAQAAESITNLRIDDAGCTTLVLNKADQFETYLKSHAEDANTHVKAFEQFDNWPADAQLGLMSMAWAMGPAFADGGNWPLFRNACASQDWLAAAGRCNMSNSWLFRRNAVDRGLFRNAAWAVQETNYDPEVLWLPVGTTRPDLHLGDTDSGETTYVADAQFFLDWLGYSMAQSTSGTFDQEMLDKVKAFQQDEGFPVTGTVGPLTWAALGYQVPHN